MFGTGFQTHVSMCDAASSSYVVSTLISLTNTSTKELYYSCIKLKFVCWVTRILHCKGTSRQILHESIHGKRKHGKISEDIASKID